MTAEEKKKAAKEAAARIKTALGAKVAELMKAVRAEKEAMEAAGGDDAYAEIASSVGILNDQIADALDAWSEGGYFEDDEAGPDPFLAIAGLA